MQDEQIRQEFNAFHLKYLNETMPELRSRLSKLETEVNRLDIALTTLQEARKRQIEVNTEHDTAIKNLKNTLNAIISAPAKSFWDIFK